MPAGDIAISERASRPWVLVGVPGKLGERMNGPAIRAWALAQALSEHFQVTAATPDPPAQQRAGIRLVPFTRRRLAREVLAHDAVLSACVPPYLFPLAKVRPTLVISDQYDPVDLEVATLPDSASTRRTVETNLALMELQLRYADIVLCANPRQKDRLQTRLNMIRRTHQPQLIELPFGLGSPPAPARHHPLRERFPQIQPQDTIVLWWGTAWRWLDPQTAVRALARLAPTRPDIKLIFATGTPTASLQPMNATPNARELARELGVLDKTILFWEDWIPYHQRHEILADAHIGLCLHGLTDEAHYSARGRYLDYLWASLPPILASGDQTSQHFAAEGFATLVPPSDEAAVSAAMIRYASDPDALTRARHAATQLAHQYRWQTLTQPLINTLKHPTPQTYPTPKPTLHIPLYYQRRLHDKAVNARQRVGTSTSRPA